MQLSKLIQRFIQVLLLFSMS